MTNYELALQDCIAYAKAMAAACRRHGREQRAIPYDFIAETLQDTLRNL